MTTRCSLPIIGLETDVETDAKGVERAMLRTRYIHAIVAAGGLPLLLPPVPSLARELVSACDGVILTGGDDPKTEAYGQPTHAKARPISNTRQAFIVALLQALDERSAMPALGICLGMQMMSLHAGGELHQYLPEVLASAADHQGSKPHAIEIDAEKSVLFAHLTADRESQRVIVSSHQQAVADAGKMRVVARAADGVVEAVDLPGRRFYAGVQ